MKVLKFFEFLSLKENSPVGVAVLGAPAGGKSYTIKKIKDVVDDARVKKAMSKGTVLTVDVLRDEFQSKAPNVQLKGFHDAFYFMKEKAKQDPEEFEKWFNDIKALWKKIEARTTEAKVRVVDDEILIDDRLSSHASLKKLDAEKIIDNLDNYQDYKRVVRFFQDTKQTSAVVKMKDVSYDEAGDEPRKIVKNIEKLHKQGYVTDVFLIHPENVASNLIQNFYRVVTGGDGGRDSSAAIVQAFRDIEANKHIYTKNAERVVEVPSTELEKTSQELKGAKVEDDQERGDKPIDVFTEVQPMSPEKGYETFSEKLTPEQREVFDALLKLASKSMDLPTDAKTSLEKLTSHMKNSEAMRALEKAASSGEYKFKFGGVDLNTVNKARKFLS